MKNKRIKKRVLHYGEDVLGFLEANYKKVGSSSSAVFLLEGKNVVLGETNHTASKGSKEVNNFSTGIVLCCDQLRDSDMVQCNSRFWE